MLKWLCLTWCGAASIILLVLPKLIMDNSASVDTQVGGKCPVCNVYMYPCVVITEIKKQHSY